MAVVDAVVDIHERRGAIGQQGAINGPCAKLEWPLRRREAMYFFAAPSSDERTLTIMGASLPSGGNKLSSHRLSSW